MISSELGKADQIIPGDFYSQGDGSKSRTTPYLVKEQTLPVTIDSPMKVMGSGRKAVVKPINGGEGRKTVLHVDESQSPSAGAHNGVYTKSNHVSAKPRSGYCASL